MIDFSYANDLQNARQLGLTFFQFKLHQHLETYVHGMGSLDLSLFEAVTGQDITYSDFTAVSNQGVSALWWALAGVAHNKIEGWEFFDALYNKAHTFNLLNFITNEQALNLTADHFLKKATVNGKYQHASGFWFAEQAAVFYRNQAVLDWICSHFACSDFAQRYPVPRANSNYPNLRKLQEDFIQIKNKMDTQLAQVQNPTFTVAYDASLVQHDVPTSATVSLQTKSTPRI